DVGHGSARREAQDRVGQGAGDIVVTIARPGGRGRAGGKRIVDRKAGSRGRPVVGHHDRVGRRTAGGSRGDVIIVGDRCIRLRGQGIHIGGGVIAWRVIACGDVHRGGIV